MVSKIYPKILASECALILDTSIQNIHKKIKDLKLDVTKSQNRVYFTHTSSKKLLNLKFKKKSFSFLLVKGGVGKTTISFLFAVRSALLGAKVALIEIDQQANLTRSCGINAKELPVIIDVITDKIPINDCLVPVCDGLDLLPSRVDNALLDNHLMMGKYPLDKVFLNFVKELKQKYDIIIFDCPPSVGAGVTAAALASDTIVMPVNPTDYSIAGLDLTYKELNNLFHQYEKTTEMKILFNKYDARTNLSFSTMSELIKHPDYGDKMIQSYIRVNQSIENSLSMGKTIFDFIKNTTEKEDFSLITNELLGF